MVSSQSILPPDGRLWFSSEGLRLGKVLLDGAPVDDRTADCIDRLDLKLAITFRRRLPREVVEAIDHAQAFARAGDLALANIRLALSSLPYPSDIADLAKRLGLTDVLLSRGMSVNELMAELGYGLNKYDPSQPRVPAGSGPTSGRWTDGTGGGVPVLPASSRTLDASALVLPALAVDGSALMTPALGAAATTALTALVATVGFGAALGLLFVPSPNNTSSRGPLPDSERHAYEFDSDTGLLRITNAAGILLAGHADANGVFRDAKTDLPFARMVAGTFVIDAAAVEAADSDDDTDTIPRVDTDVESGSKPKLCPDPGADQPQGKPSKRAIAYQEQISRMISPQRPLEYGLAINLFNPVTEELVHFDECDDNTGVMYDAKGPGYAQLLAFTEGRKSVEEKWAGQATRQRQAAGSRPIVWYFAEAEAAVEARKFFAERSIDIEVRFMPPEVP